VPRTMETLYSSIGTDWSESMYSRQLQSADAVGGVTLCGND